jgi:HK97 family phage major capsid protein
MVDISRSDVATLIQEAYADDFLGYAAKSSAVLAAFPTRNLGTKTTHEPVLATKPHAKWVIESSSDPAGIKPSGKITWADKTLVAEELAVIVPVHENVLDDATTNVLDDITKAGGEAMAFALDAAVTFGINKPTTWTSNALLASAVADSNVLEVGESGTADDLSGTILQAAELLSDRYDPTTLLTRRGLRYKLANLRATTGEPIFMSSMSGDAMQDSVYGLSTYYETGTVDDGSGGDALVWDPSRAEALVVDRSRVLIGIRQDIQVKFLDQATLTGPSNTIINLAERDMVAFRFKARYAYALGDNVAYGQTVSTSSPVAAVTPAGGS